MKIVYIGVVDFSYHCLQEVLKNKGEVVGLVTLRGSKVNSDFCDLAPLAEEYGIPVHYCTNVNEPDTIAWIRKKNPDIIFCWGISQLIKPVLLSLPPMGVVGVHPALLPQNRGRHPLIWALVLGLEKSGLTFFFMDEGADSGPILSQAQFDINDDDTSADLYEKIKKLATKQIAEFMPQLTLDSYMPIKQDETKANYWRKRTPKDGVIDWRMNAKTVRNLVRALTRPYPGATFGYKGQSFIAWEVQEFTGDIPHNAEPGKVLKAEENKLIVKCYDSAIIITKYEPQGGFVEGEYLE